MGPRVKKEERTSQASPFATQFLNMLQGALRQSQGAQTVGPNQGNLGNSPSQFLSSVGGVNTAAGVQDFTPQLIEAATNQATTARNKQVADLREGFDILGGRFSSNLATEELRTGNEAANNLAALTAQILTDQNARTTQAKQFDAQANTQILQLLASIAAGGVLPEELIVSPGIGDQLLTGAVNTGTAFAGRGG